MAFQLSPGVLTTEQDLTNVVPAVATTIGGIVGEYNWGPANQIVSIDSENNLVAVFGKPSTSAFLDFMTAASFLAYGSNCLVVREVGSAAKNAVSSGTAELIVNSDKYYESFAAGEGTVGPWAAKYPGTKGNHLKVSSADYASFTNTSVKTLAVTAGGSAYSADTIATISAPNVAGGILATATVTIDTGVITAIAITNPGSGYTTAPTVTLSGTAGSGATTAVTLTTAWEYANQFDYAPSTTTHGINAGGTDDPLLDEMHVVVVDEDGGFTGTKGTIIEKFPGVSKASDAKDDVNQSNYYKNVINQRSKYIWSMDHITAGTDWGVLAIGKTTAFQAIQQVSADHTTSLIGGVDAAPAVADLQTGYNLFSNDELVDVSLIMTSGHSMSVADYVIDNVAEVRKDCLVLCSPLRSSVVDNVGAEVTSITADLAALTRSSYAEMDSGWKYMYDRYNDRYVYVPLNGDVAGTCVVADVSNDPWFSPAGYNRGVIKNAVKLAWSPKKSERDELYKMGVNPVVGFPGNGIILFGDKTLLAKPSAFNRINVRRLFIVLEKAIATAAKYQLFEFNDAFTRAQFRSLVEPFLRDVQGRRGIYDFRVVCDETNNTAEIIDQNEFRADIFVKPAKAINFITLTFVATRTGISFEELGA